MPKTRKLATKANRKPFPFLMGSDPEFNVLFQDKKLVACGVMKKLLAKDKTADFSNADEDMGWTCDGMKGNIGWDGCDATGEMRPNPGSSADEHVENIRSILQETFKRLPLFELNTLSTYAPVGGHIHLDIPQGLSQRQIQTIVVRMMSFYLPLFLGENAIARNVRSRSDYGQFENFRTNSGKSGEKAVVELRAPSAEWITCPEVALGFLAFVGTVWHEILNNPRNVLRHKNVVLSQLSQLKALSTITKAELPIVTHHMVSEIKKAVKTFEFYPEYKAEIDFILDPEKVKTIKNQAGYDLYRGWGLKKDGKKSNKKTFMSEQQIKKLMKASNVDEDFLEQSHMPYNSDRNVGIFATALETRMMALGWKPNFRFYLFGMREGIQSPAIARKKGEMVFACGQELIKTPEDKRLIEESLYRMVKRGEESFETTTTIDPEKGLIQDARPVVGFGIPAKWRGEKPKVKDFLNLIWEVDRLAENKWKPLQAIAGKEEAGVGEVTEALSNPEGSIQSLEDFNSTGQRMATGAIRGIQQEFGNSLQQAIAEASAETSIIIDSPSEDEDEAF